MWQASHAPCLLVACPQPNLPSQRLHQRHTSAGKGLVLSYLSGACHSLSQPLLLHALPALCTFPSPTKPIAPAEPTTWLHWHFLLKPASADLRMLSSLSLLPYVSCTLAVSVTDGVTQLHTPDMIWCCNLSSAARYSCSCFLLLPPCGSALPLDSTDLPLALPSAADTQGMGPGTLAGCSPAL